MSGGVELDLDYTESDVDEFSSSLKSKHSRNVSIEEDQVFEEVEEDDDDEIAIIEPTNSKISIGPQITIESEYSNPIEPVFSNDTKSNNSNSNGKRRKSERASSSSSSSSTTSSTITSSSSSHQSSNGSCFLEMTNNPNNHSQDEQIDNEIHMEVSNGKIKQENDGYENESRKSTNLPTLMITVKNEMAHPIYEQIMPIDDSTETATLRHIFSDAVYFLIKSGNEENISLAKTRGVWSTPPANENKLNRAFREHRNVILIFSVAESKAFQGFARMSCEARHDSQPVQWILPPGMNNRAFSGVIYIDWITRRSLPFAKTSHLFNSWNENKPIKIGRDGQDIEPRCAEALCRLFPSDPSIDIMSIARKAKNNKKRPSSRSQSRSPVLITTPTSIPIDSSSLIIKRQISKDQNRRSSPSSTTKYRPISSSDLPSRHSSTRHHHRSPSNHDRPRHEQARNREYNSKDSPRKRRRRSNSTHSDHGNKNNSSRKRTTHRNNGDQSSYNSTNKTMAKIISSGTYEEYMSHVLASHAQYNGFGSAMFPIGGYPMGYDPSGFYPMGYDHRGMPIHGGGYDVPMDMYLPQSTSSISSRSRNAGDYEQEISAFLRHTTASNAYPPNDNSGKSHRNHHHHQDNNNYHHKSSSRHRSKSRERRR